jgi:hypothetical protein
MKTSFDDFIKVTPIYIDIYSQHHFENYLKQRQIDLQSKSSTNGATKNEEPIPPIDKFDLSPKPTPSIPILPSSTTG